ncbi:MAG: hypothetical protein LBJ12_01575 [Oscillospiraceae bacterium]|jgi:hypothetical protein|nr:hypothetical protein [Oscillospiraceae bacterium]
MPNQASALPVTDFQSVILVILARDEVHSLRETVESLSALLPAGDVEQLVMFLAPDSTPECNAMALELEKTVSSFPVRTWLQQTQMPVAELQRLLAQKSKASHALMLSADLEISPEMALQMLQACKKNPVALVSLSRWREGGGFTRYTKWQLPLHRFFQSVVRALYGARLSTDATAGYCAVAKQIFEGLCLREKRQSVFLEYKLTLLRLGLPLIEIPVQFRVRREGKSTGGFWHKLRYLVPLLRVRFLPPEKLFRFGDGCNV